MKNQRNVRRRKLKKMLQDKLKRLKRTKGIKEFDSNMSLFLARQAKKRKEGAINAG